MSSHYSTKRDPLAISTLRVTLLAIGRFASRYLMCCRNIDMYCSPVLRHWAGLIQAANFRSAVVF
jgi:hypothetical protein